MKKLLIYSLLALLGFSCNQSVDYFEPQTDADVKFVINVGESTDIDPTKATPLYNDVVVQNIDLLVFNSANNQYLGRIKVDQSTITGTGATRTFYAKFSAGILGVGSNIIVNFVINGRTLDGVTDRVNFSAVTANMLESVAIPSLVTNTLAQGTGLGEAQPIVMWGRTTISSVTAGMVVPNVNILRTAAAIEVKSTAANLEITSISVGNVSASGRVAPSNYTSGAANQTTATLPAVVENINYFGTNGVGGVWNVKNSEPITTGQPNPIVYIYEKKGNTTDYPYIIIRASYSGTDGYYKVVLSQLVGADRNVVELVRNNKYILTITKANGPGYPNVTDAIANLPIGLSADLVESNSQISHLVSDGTTTVLGISNIYYIYILNSVSSNGYSNRTAHICKVYLKNNVNSNAAITAANITVTPASLASNVTITPEGGNIYSINLVQASVDVASSWPSNIEVNYNGLSLSVNFGGYYAAGTKTANNTIYDTSSGNSLLFCTSTSTGAYGSNSNLANWKVEYLSGAPASFHYPGTPVPTVLSQMTTANGYFPSLDSRFNTGCYMLIDISNLTAKPYTIVKVQGYRYSKVDTRWYELFL